MPLSLSLLRGFLVLTVTASLAFADRRMRLGTYNIRQDAYPDSIPVQQSLAALPDPSQQYPAYYGTSSEQPWSTRRIKVYQRLRHEVVVLVGKQFIHAEG